MTNRRDRITGNVAAILDHREVALNVGSSHGVEAGMRFVILSREATPVTDPVSGEDLGSVHLPKQVVKIVRVLNEKMSVGRTFRVVKGRPGIGASSIFGPTPDRVETLSVAEGDTLREAVEEWDSVVKVGDTVVETVGDEYDL